LFLLSEYQKGCAWEIYITKLAKLFDGAKFCELSYALYDRKGVVLFALQLTDKKVPGASRLILNPGSFVIPSQDDYLIEAFVIAKNKASSDLSFSDAPLPDQQSALQMVKSNFGSVAYMIKSTVGSGDAAAPERRKSTLRDVNKLRTAIGYTTKLDSLVENDDHDNGLNKVKESKWKKLKRSALLERKIKSDSFQEVVHRLEDEHFSSTYYVRSFPIEISQVTVKSNVFDEVPSMHHHIIIIGKNLKNLFDLIKPLRAKHLGPMKYIVILHPYDIPLDVWRRISIFDGLLFIQGSSLEDNNLRRAGIFRASTVLVLADGSAEQLESKSQALVDADAIFSYQHVKRLNPSTQIIVEIVNQSNIGYLEDPLNPSLVDDPMFSPQVACGQLFTTSLLDSIVCQAYYNPEIVKVVNKLIAGMDQIERQQFMVKAAEEVGNVPKQNDDDDDDEESVSSDDGNKEGEGSDAGSDSDDSDKKVKKAAALLKKQASKRESKKVKDVDLSKQEVILHKAKKKLLKIPNSCLYQISVPEPCIGKPYGVVYQYLASQGMIPLGIYRGILAMGIGMKANRLPYVYSNPSKETELYSCDLIFVLSTKPVKAKEKLEIKDWLLNLQMQKGSTGKIESNDGSNATATTTTSVPASTDPKQILNDNYDKSVKKLEEKFKKFITDMDDRLISIIEKMEKVLEDNGCSITGMFDDDMSRTNQSISALNSVISNSNLNSVAVDGPMSERSLDTSEEGRAPTPNVKNNSSNNGNGIPLNTSGIFRKNSVKRKSFSNPLVPVIHEESHSSNPSGTQSEEESNEEELNIREKISNGRKLVDREMSSSQQPHTLFQERPNEVRIPSLERAISNISMDFSVNEDEEDVMIDTSPLDPLGYDDSLPSNPVIQQSYVNYHIDQGNNESQDEESKASDVKIKPVSSPGTPLSYRKPSISSNIPPVQGPKLTSVSPLPLEKLARVKSLTDFKDTRTGKVRNIGNVGSYVNNINISSQK
jgi:hypothetical protein